MVAPATAVLARPPSARPAAWWKGGPPAGRDLAGDPDVPVPPGRSGQLAGAYRTMAAPTAGSGRAIWDAGAKPTGLPTGYAGWTRAAGPFLFITLNYS